MSGSRISLLGWLDRPVSGHGVHTLGEDGQWTFVDYAELAARVRATAVALADRGVSHDDVVTITHRSGPDFLAVFFGALAAGATPAPVVPPGLFQDRGRYESHLAHIVRLAQPRVAAIGAELAGQLSSFLGSLGVPAVVSGRAGPTGQTASAAGLPAGMKRPHLALLQFTSGSSAPPKGVEVSWVALEAQLALIARWLRWGPDEGCATWLPVHHDMGLVGQVVMSVVSQSDLWIMQPDQFIRQPTTWLRCLGDGRACMTAVPPFSLRDIVLRRVRREDLEDCDFSSVQAFVVGAEPVPAEVLELFTGFLAPLGFRGEMLVPAYGLAEATLAVTGKPVGEPVQEVHVDRTQLRMGEKIRIEEVEGTGLQGAMCMVSCGYPLAEVRLGVRDETGDLPPGVLGEIVVAGASLADGYRGREVGRATWADQGGFRTGDAGFLWNGQLFVLGRLGDGLKVRGVQVFAEELEADLARVDGLRSRRYAVVLGAVDGTDTAAAIVQARPGAWADEAFRLLRRSLGGTRVMIVAASPGSIVRTSSGKPKRRELFQKLMAGSVEGVVLYDTAAEERGKNDDDETA